jgi:hypothetical protein
MVCDDDGSCDKLCLNYDYRFYRPFINKYCPGIQKLILGPMRLENATLLRQEIEQTLFTVLRTELSKFQNLREPEVTGSNGQPIAGIAELMKEIRVEQETYAI